MIESGNPSLLDIVTFDPEITVVEGFSYPVGAVCLLQRGPETCVFNIDSFYGYKNILYTPFQNPEKTTLIYSRFFLERLRNGNARGIDTNSIPNIRIDTIPDFVQIRGGLPLNQTSEKIA
jgi:hypothetical protein